MFNKNLMDQEKKSRKNAFSKIGFSALVFLFSILSILILINSTGRSINSDSISANLLTGGDTKTGGETTTTGGGKTTTDTTGVPDTVTTTGTTDTKTQTTPDSPIIDTTKDNPTTPINPTTPTNTTTPTTTTNSNTPTGNSTTSNNNSSTSSSSQNTTYTNPSPINNNSVNNTNSPSNNSINNTNSPAQNSNSKDLPNSTTNEIEPSSTKINFLEELNKINHVIKEFTDKIYTAEIVTFSEATALTGITLGAVSMITGTIVFNFRGLSHLLGRLWSILIYGFGIKKRARPWGTVYDSSTKQPIDPAYVILRNMEGETINTCMTDIDGRYGFLVEPGKYIINAYKTHFVFPSLKLANKITDEFYDDLYFGEQIEVQTSGQVLAKNIPMDRKNFDWNEYAKNKQQKTKFFHKSDVIFRKLTNFLFAIGFILAVLIFLKDPTSYNMTILVLYILLSLSHMFVIRKHIMGTVTEKATGMPLSYGILRIYSIGDGKEITRKILDRLGNYYCLIQNGNYMVNLEKKNLDGSYTKVFTSPKIVIEKGYLQKNFRI